MSGPNFRFPFVAQDDENICFDSVVDMASPAKYCRACFPFDIWPTKRPFSRRSRRRVGPVPGRNIAWPYNRRKTPIYGQSRYVGTRIRPYPAIAIFGAVVLVRCRHPVVVMGGDVAAGVPCRLLLVFYRKMGRPIGRRNS